MKEQIVYLDYGSLVKRYVKEPGSKIAREVYLRAYSGELIITFNSWNIGEVLGAFNKAYVRGILSGKNYTIAKSKFLHEIRRLARLGVLRLIPVRFRLLVEGWRLLEKHHLYPADALQIVSAKEVNATEFLTGDERVYEAAKTEGLNAVLTI